MVMHGTADIRRDVAKTRVIVSELEHSVTSTHIMVSDIHRTMAKHQEGSGGENLSVSDTRTVPITTYSLLSRLKPGQYPRPPMGPISYICI